VVVAGIRRGRLVRERARERDVHDERFGIRRKTQGRDCIAIGRAGSAEGRIVTVAGASTSSASTLDPRLPFRPQVKAAQSIARSTGVPFER